MGMMEKINKWIGLTGDLWCVVRGIQIIGGQCEEKASLPSTEKCHMTFVRLWKKKAAKQSASSLFSSSLPCISMSSTQCENMAESWWEKMSIMPLWAAAATVCLCLLHLQMSGIKFFSFYCKRWVITDTNLHNSPHTHMHVIKQTHTEKNGCF